MTTFSLLLGILATAYVVSATVPTYGTVLASFYTDNVGCNTSSFMGSQTVVSAKCNHMTNSESGWPWIKWSCNSQLATCITSTSFSDDCVTPVASHYNYCNECKANSLRTCNGQGLNMSVTYWNCTDDTCSSCQPLVTLPVNNGNTECNVNPLPNLISGTSLTIHRVSECVTLNHSWWTATDCGAGGAGQFGSDLIVLNVCNNGWKFECLP